MYCCSAAVSDDVQDRDPSGRDRSSFDSVRLRRNMGAIEERGAAPRPPALAVGAGRRRGSPRPLFLPTPVYGARPLLRPEFARNIPAEWRKPYEIEHKWDMKDVFSTMRRGDVEKTKLRKDKSVLVQG